MKTNEEYLAEYLAARGLTTVSRSAVGKRKTKLKRYLTYLEQRGKAVWEAGVREAAEYAGRLKEQGLKSDTAVDYVCVAGSFCAWLKAQGVMFGNPFSEVTKLKRTKTVPRNLPQPKEMEALLERLSRWEEEKNLRYAKRRYRMHVLSELLYSTGMRIGEAASLRVGDVDVDAKTVSVKDCKTRKRRLCFLNEYAAGVLRFYLERLRRLVCKEGGEYLFGTGNGWWLAYDLKLTLAPFCSTLGLSRFTSHCFRHSVGYHMLKAGCDIRYIQEILGHARLTSTQIYTKVDRRDLLGVIDRYHPRTFARQSVAIGEGAGQIPQQSPSLRAKE